MNYCVECECFSLQVLMKVVLNQGCAGPVLNSLFFGYTLATREGLQDFQTRWRAKLSTDLLPTTMHSAMCWGPFHVLSFLYIPESYRMLCISVLTVVWMAYLSWRAFRVLPCTALSDRASDQDSEMQ